MKEKIVRPGKVSVLYGSCGSGKSLSAMKIASEFKGKVKVLDPEGCWSYGGKLQRFGLNPSIVLSNIFPKEVQDISKMADLAEYPEKYNSPEKFTEFMQTLPKDTDLLVIDYLSLMCGVHKFGSARYLSVLTKYAETTGTAVLVTEQVPRKSAYIIPSTEIFQYLLTKESSDEGALCLSVKEYTGDGELLPYTEIAINFEGLCKQA